MLQSSKNLILKVVGIFAESFNFPISQYNSCLIHRDIFILMEWYVFCVIDVDLLEWRCYYIGHISLKKLLQFSLYVYVCACLDDVIDEILFSRDLIEFEFMSTSRAQKNRLYCFV